MLVRPGVGFEVNDGRVVVSRGTVWVDPGAPSHDETASPGPMESAVDEGRSPFPRAPLVVLIALERESGRAVWASNLVNALLEHRVEARLALESPPPPPYRCRPCLPDQNSIQALQPDVIITLDDTALDVVPSWCDRRSTVLVHHTGERTLTAELVSWRVGEAAGRLRAFIGSSVAAPELASLCSRLVSGPFPVPPPRNLDPRRPTPTRVRSPRPPRRVTVVHAAGGPPDRLQHFLLEAAAQGATTSAISEREGAVATEHDVVVLTGDVDETQARQLVASRAAGGRQTVVDVTSSNRIPSTVDLCRRATASTRALQSLLEDRGVTVRALPDLLPRRRLAELSRAREADGARNSTTLSLLVDQPNPDELAAAVSALDALLESDETITLALYGDVDALPLDFRARTSVTLVGDNEPESITVGRVQVWLGSAASATRAGWPRPLVEAGYLGVPTVFATACRGDVDDALLCRWALPDPTRSNEWLGALRDCLTTADDHTELERRADFLFGRRAAMSIVNRLLGWASVRTTSA